MQLAPPPDPHLPGTPSDPTAKRPAAACPHCGRIRRFDQSVLPSSTRCDGCGAEYQPAPPEWRRWELPVARVLTPHEQSLSLHHLMVAAKRAFFPDFLLQQRARRTHEFYCGHCYRLHRARTWDIAAQERCDGCGALMIVPTPFPPPFRRRGSGRRPADTLYCPRCGAPAPGSDLSRRTAAWCAQCHLGF